MDDIQKSIVRVLHTAAERLREERLPEELINQLERLATQVDQPCVVAVVGLVKAGKSTFVNALLGADLATVGTVETTATINHFRHGQPAIYCIWRGGQREQVNLDFVNSLQGNDLETLRRADGIDHLEYYLDEPYLQEVILVDTPGIGSVIDEHQNRVADYINLERQLRQRHSDETYKIGSNADAIIYLINTHARGGDKLFLEEFQQVTQGQSSSFNTFNAVAIMGKIDLYPDTIHRRKELAEKIASQLREQINTVLPISAGIQLALEQLLEDDKAGLHRLTEAIHGIPPEHMKKFLSSDVFYMDPELDRATYPIPFEERKSLLGSMPWTVFTTIAGVASREKDIRTIEQELIDFAGFRQLKEVLDRHIFRRSKILRCNRILNEACRIISKNIKRQYLENLRQNESENKMRESRYLTFIRQAAQFNPSVARELEELVKERASGRVKHIEELVTSLEQEMEVIDMQLKRYNEDFEILTLLLDHDGNECFPPSEQDELRPLLGLYGLELEKRLPAGRISSEYVRAKQLHCRGVSMTDSNPIRRKVALQAVSCYGYILSRMN